MCLTGHNFLMWWEKLSLQTLFPGLNLEISSGGTQTNFSGLIFRAYGINSVFPLFIIVSDKKKMKLLYMCRPIIKSYIIFHTSFREVMVIKENYLSFTAVMMILTRLSWVETVTV